MSRVLVVAAIALLGSGGGYAGLPKPIAARPA
jgi:hypothetical protein